MIIFKKREKIAVYEERIRSTQSLILTGFIDIAKGTKRITKLKHKIEELKKSLQQIK